MTSTAAPVSQNERMDILDVLRGIAILGIFLDNVFGFTGYGFYNMTQREALPTFHSDMVLGIAELTLIHGKIYSLFSWLFGVGFSVMLHRYEQKGMSLLSIFYRRLFILLLIGAAHLFLLWEGDILLLYALLGFILPLFRKCTDKTILIWAFALIASPILIDCIKVLLQIKLGGFIESYAQAIDKKTGLPTDDSFSKYLFKSGSGWQEWRNWQASGWLYRYAYIIESNRMPKVLGMFLIGLYAGRKMIFSQLDQYQYLLRQLRKWGFIIGIPCSLAMAYFEIDGLSVPNAKGLLDTVFYAFGVMSLSLAYMATICLFWNKTKGNNFLKKLVPVGRMALTNYLMQTVLAIIIFYGVGFGVGGNMGPTIFIPIALAIYALQIVYSNWWLSKFN